MPELRLLENVSVDGAGQAFAVDGGDYTLSVWATSFGGGTVTIEGSPDNGTTWIEFTDWGGTSAFGSNIWKETGKLRSGILVRAVLNGSAGAVDVNAKLFNQDDMATIYNGILSGGLTGGGPGGVSSVTGVNGVSTSPTTGAVVAELDINGLPAAATPLLPTYELAIFGAGPNNEKATIADIVAAVSGAWQFDNQTGAAGPVFTLPQNVQGTTSVMMTINGVAQTPGVDYFVTPPTTVTYTAATSPPLQPGDAVTFWFYPVGFTGPAPVATKASYSYSGFDGQQSNGKAVRRQNQNGNRNYTLNIPSDFGSLVACHAMGMPNNTAATATAAGIRLETQYGLLGQSYNFIVESNPTNTVDLTGTAGTNAAIDLSSVLNNLLPDHQVGLLIDHNASGPNNFPAGSFIDYFGIRLEYIPS